MWPAEAAGGCVGWVLQKETVRGMNRGERGAGEAPERAQRRHAAEQQLGRQLLAAGVPVAGHGLPVSQAHVPGGQPGSCTPGHAVHEEPPARAGL